MKYLKTMGLCLVALFAMSLVASAVASAATPVWEIKKSGTLNLWLSEKRSWLSRRKVS